VSAVVVIDANKPLATCVEIPYVDRTSVDADGRLLLFRGYGDPLAIFRAHGWAYVVVTTPERGPDGKFVKRGRR